MICLFEDNKDSNTAKLFRGAYSKEISSKFVYLCGNGKLLSWCKRELSNSTDDIAVFMDLLPDNRATIDIYKRLRLLANSNSRLHIIPIICSEYYVIKAIEGLGMLNIRFIDVADCTAGTIDLQKLRVNICDNSITNYEKYCKSILENCIEGCNNLNNKSDKTRLKGKFYKEKCDCKGCNFACIGEAVIDKSLRVLRKYKVVPALNNKCGKGISALDAHKLSVDEYNRLCSSFNNDSYKAIRKIDYISRFKE